MPWRVPTCCILMSRACSSRGLADTANSASSRDTSRCNRLISTLSLTTCHDTAAVSTRQIHQWGMWADPPSVECPACPLE